MSGSRQSGRDDRRPRGASPGHRSGSPVPRSGSPVPRRGSPIPRIGSPIGRGGRSDSPSGSHLRRGSFGATSSPEAQLSDKEIGTLSSRIQSLSSSSSVHRTPGTDITVRTNVFAMKFPKNLLLHDYSLRITPKVKGSDLKKLIEQMETTPPISSVLNESAHDNAYRFITKGSLPPGLTLTVPYPEEQDASQHPGSYEIKFQKCRELNSSDLEQYLQGQKPEYNPSPIISALNLVVTANAAKKSAYSSGHHFFVPPSALGEHSVSISPQLEAWKGFFLTLRPAQKSLMVNVDLCLSAFYSPKAQLSEAMIQYRQLSLGAENPTTFYKNVKISTTYHGHKRTSVLRGFGGQSARRTMIEIEEYGTISVEQYFSKKYHIILQHADDLPVVNIGKARDTYIPAELCQIESGHPFGGPLPSREAAAMSKIAAHPPHVLANALSTQGFGLIGVQQHSMPMSKFGLEVSAENTIPARVLQAPKIHYQSTTPNVVNGKWNTIGARLHRPAQFTRAGILVLSSGGNGDFTDSSDPALRTAATDLLRKCADMGMPVDNALPPLAFVRIQDSDPNDTMRASAIDAIERGIKELPERPNFLIVFNSVSDPHVYSGLVRLCDTKLGIRMVCTSSAKIKEAKEHDRYLAGIALKVNAKLGGINHQIDTSAVQWLKDSMLVGISVSHPGLGSIKGAPSITAVVASCDSSFSHFPASVNHQDAYKQIVLHVRTAMEERLKEYYGRMKSLPEHILIFRQNVSSEQRTKLLEKELPEIKASFRVFQNYEPKLTLVLCGRGHKLRFFPLSSEQTDASLNTPAGTLIDSTVTSDKVLDFFLQAHPGVPGSTVRTTHYTVLYDDNKFPADRLKQGIYDLSYTLARTTSSIRRVAPMHWAAGACKRARNYLHGILHPLARNDVAEDEVGRVLEDTWGSGVHENLRSTMFYA